MQNKNFSHFGLKDAGNKDYVNNGGSKKIEPRKQAMVDGYGFGDRMLENVMFIITIQDDNTLKAEIHPDSASYFEQLNKEMWLKEDIKYAMLTDFFYSMDENEEVDLNLIMQDGRYNFEHDKNFKLSPVVITDQQIAAINANLENNN